MTPDDLIYALTNEMSPSSIHAQRSNAANAANVGMSANQMMNVRTNEMSPSSIQAQRANAANAVDPVNAILMNLIQQGGRGGR